MTTAVTWLAIITLTVGSVSVLILVVAELVGMNGLLRKEDRRSKEGNSREGTVGGTVGDN